MRMNNTFSNPQYLNVLKKCSTISQLKQLHAQLITIGLTRFTYITSKLLSFSALTEPEYAYRIFSQLPIPTIFDYNTMISSYSKTSNQQMGILLFKQMCHNNIKPNSRTFPVLIKTCRFLSTLVQVHGHVAKSGYVCDVYLTSSLICMYAGFECLELAKRVFEESLFKNVVCCTSLITGCFVNGRVEDARKVFDEMLERNDVSYSAMISGFVRNECFNEAIELFNEMKKYGLVKANRSLLLCVLNACGAVGALDVGSSIHCRLVENSFSIDLEFGTTLIDFYAKCGDIEKAEEIFNTMLYKDVATWSAMVLGLATNGKNEMAIKLFEEMEQKGPVPNDVTFVAALVACNHKTLVREAWRLFGKMSKVYNVRLDIEHYGCMVDILARSGDLKGAEIMIKLMPMEPDGAIWGSFLHGCLTNSDTRIVEKAGKRLLELDPQHSGRYALLANIYANMGSWDAVIKFRNLMIKRNVSTTPGWSFIEIDGIVHKFLVNDQCHPQARDVYDILKVLYKVLTI